MRVARTIVLVSFMLTLAHAQTGWNRFTYADGNFSILFPGTPQKRTGDGRRQLIFTAVTGGESYRITYADYPVGTAWENAVNDERDAIMKMTPGRDGPRGAHLH